MQLLCRGIFSAMLLIGSVACAVAEDANDRAATTSTQNRVLTGKERLGPKWSDEQRIDNCKVPVDKRGTRPRPSTCPNTPSS